MDLIKFSIKNHVTIIVSVLIVVIFGLLSLVKLPYQLTPNITKPVVSVTTTWPGATPYEIESEVIQEQEDVLKSLNNLVEYNSTSSNNVGQIYLKFKLGTNLRNALQDVSSKLDKVNSYPDGVNKPSIDARTEDTSIIMMLQTLKSNSTNINEYKTYLENEIIPILKRVDGVEGIQTAGGQKKEIQVNIDINKLAAYNLTINQVINTLRSENIDVSAGIQDVGRRSYRVRTVHKFSSLKDIKNIVLISKKDQIIKIKDIATVNFGYEKAHSFCMYNGKDGIFVGVHPNTTVNVVQLTDDVKSVVKKLNKNLLKQKGLKLIWANDEKGYIINSVALLQKNILIGAALAVFILILFLRAVSPIAVVTLAIPISILGTFIVFEILGRSLNTISLAGISFSVGMLVDSTIVVLENIDRHRKEGMKITRAAYIGTKEVFGALIASVLTTMAVLVPIIFLQDEAGQLFKDIAIAICSSVLLSLFVSITVIPMLWRKFASLSKKGAKGKSLLTNFGDNIVKKFMSIITLSLKNTFTKIVTILILTTISITIIYTLFPKTSYLPKGNKNLIISVILPPPGLSYEERYSMGKYLMKEIKPHLNKSIKGFPGVSNAFSVSFGDNVIFGGTSVNDNDSRKLIPLFSSIVSSFPSTHNITYQTGVFEGFGGSSGISIDISGNNIEEITKVGTKLFLQLRQNMKGSQMRPIPSLELLYPEVRLKPKQNTLKTFGLSSKDLGIIADVYMGGKIIGDFEQDGKKKLDLALKTKNSQIQTPQDILNAQVVLPNGSLLPFNSLSSSENTTGITQIRHVNGKRTITLRIRPPVNMTIEEAMQKLEKIIKQVKTQEKDFKDLSITMGGTADQLSQTMDELKFSFILALVIIYLLMAVLFSNFLYPIVIMFTVPLAIAGGFIGLALTNTFIATQPLDVLTMLGFIILIGIVVNNAILIVHQSLNLIRDHGYEHKEAVIEATRTRIRPIYMSSLTSVFGMLPLVLFPGSGSEFYRGLGSVITGGLILSTVFTIFITPALLMFFIKLEKGLKKKVKITDETEQIENDLK